MLFRSFIFSEVTKKLTMIGLGIYIFLLLVNLCLANRVTCQYNSGMNIQDVLMKIIMAVGKQLICQPIYCSSLFKYLAAFTIVLRVCTCHSPSAVLR